MHRKDSGIGRMLWAVVIVAAFAVGAWGSFADADRPEVPAYVAPGPYSIQQDTLSIANGDSISRAFNIGGAVRVGLHVPTITSATIHLQAGYDPDSTFAFVTDVDGTPAQWEIGAGTGAIFIDVTRLVTGARYFKVETGAAQGALRTFHVDVKY